MERSSRQKLDREITELRDIMIQMDLADIYRTFYPNTKDYIFFSAYHGTFSKNDHTIRHRVSLNRYKKIEIMPYILLDHHRLKQIIKNKRNNAKPTNS